MYRTDTTDDQVAALVADLEARGIDARGSTLATLPALLDRLHAEHGYEATGQALHRARIPLCEMCARTSRATPAVVYAELNTGSHAVVVYMNVCEACVPKVYAIPPEG